MHSRAARALAAAAVLALIGGCGASSDPASPVSGVTVHDDDGLHGAVLDSPYDAPRVALTATDGTTYRLDEDANRPLTLVFFGYTHCPDICQLVMSDIAAALTRLDESERPQVGMLFVTTDPARDDPRALREYLDRFDPGFGGLTGTLADVVAAGTVLGVPVEKGARLPSGGYEVVHGTQVIGLLPDGTAPVVWTEGIGPERLADDIRTILRDGVDGAADAR